MRLWVVHAPLEFSGKTADFALEWIGSWRKSSSSKEDARGERFVELYRSAWCDNGPEELLRILSEFRLGTTRFNRELRYEGTSALDHPRVFHFIRGL